MGKENLDILDKLDREDREKVSYFIRLLASQTKYRKLAEELEERRKEIREGKVLGHEEIWKELDV